MLEIEERLVFRKLVLNRFHVFVKTWDEIPVDVVRANELVAFHFFHVYRLEFLMPALFPEFFIHRENGFTLKALFTISFLRVSVCVSLNVVVTMDYKPFYLLPVGILVVRKHAVPVIDDCAILRHYSVINQVTGYHHCIYPLLLKIVQGFEKTFMSGLVDYMDVA